MAPSRALSSASEALNLLNCMASHPSPAFIRLPSLVSGPGNLRHSCHRRFATSRSLHVISSSDPQPPDYLSESELKIFNMIKSKLHPTSLEVQDVSGGCGSMYALDIVSAQFKGLPVIKQHRMVNEVLGDEIKRWHGVQLKTRAGE
ncbi:bola-like protein [Viridothelium virens]|uniref:Bola-like protein n=1 Tax=Viridothelium virens TaxID=1048519 RepID=A0A6A6HD69_VIRVR|nr:bola-like protein [Viridothelium virens]